MKLGKMQIYADLYLNWYRYKLYPVWFCISKLLSNTAGISAKIKSTEMPNFNRKPEHELTPSAHSAFDETEKPLSKTKPAYSAKECWFIIG